MTRLTTTMLVLGTLLGACGGDPEPTCVSVLQPDGSSLLQAQCPDGLFPACPQPPTPNNGFSRSRDCTDDGEVRCTGYIVTTTGEQQPFDVPAICTDDGEPLG